MLREAVLVKAWLPDPSRPVRVSEEAEWFRGAMTHVSDSPSAYRPIVLLDEVGKLLERIISVRLVQHLEHVGPNLSPTQFGFRAERSTVDAILRVRELAEGAVDSGGVLLAVSLDIANAFNTLPWACIRQALIHHGVPAYLQAIVADYLTARTVECATPRGLLCREVSCGVPQGSVL
ncbi:hypothetical protein ABMA27_005524 [Loxostege sticticalis]|uniref:Reverse transcriptase domain-containing protein n=1 Tax=Loxostege sticticalis TaxID=481309 RepID=A0ABR3HJG5_LOXSC